MYGIGEFTNKRLVEAVKDWSGEQEPEPELKFSKVLEKEQDGLDNGPCWRFGCIICIAELPRKRYY